MEEKKFTAREGFQTINAEYIGLAAKPLTGEKNGKTWTKSKAKFKPVGKETEWTFIIWSPIKSDNSKYKTLDELEQFKTYNIVWTEKDESYNGREWVSKTIQIINDEQEIKEGVHKEAINNPPKVPTQEELELFKEDYLSYCEKNNKLTDKKSFLFQWFVKKHALETQAVFKFAKDHIATQQAVNDGVEEKVE